MFWIPLNLLLAFTTGFIVYNLALTLIGYFPQMKNTVFPVSFFTVLIIISKIIFRAPATLHTLLVVFFCAICLYMFNSIDLLSSLIGALLGVTILTFASMLLVYPLLQKIGINLTNNIRTWDWVMFNIGELIIPFSVFIILRIKKFSIKNIYYFK